MGRIDLAQLHGNDLLTVARLSELTGYSPGRIDHVIGRLRIKPRRAGRVRVIVEEADVEAIVRELDAIEARSIPIRPEVGREVY